MHPDAFEFVAQWAAPGPVVEFGSLDINGSVRELFEGEYLGIDLVPGPGVDLVADAALWDGLGRYAVVVCCEVFEHLEYWPALVQSAAKALMPGGLLIVTCAGPGRGPHSAVDGNALRPDEWYENIEPYRLAEELAAAGFSWHQVEQVGLDVQAVARWT